MVAKKNGVENGHCSSNGHEMSDAELFAAKSEEYAKRISKLQEEYLLPLKEDLSDWLKQIFVLDDLNTDNFMCKLDNGVIVCKLAKIIEESCNLELGSKKMSSMRGCRTPKVSQPLFDCENSIPEEKIERIITANSDKIKEKCSETSHTLESKQQQQSDSVDRKQSLEAKWCKTKTPSFSAKTMKCWENAKSESFYARDNVSNFIEWTRALGVRDAVTFETEDLVLHNNQRNVVLCLLEVARIACNKHNFAPAPGLVVFEKEIDEQIEKEASAEANSSVFLNDRNSDTKYAHTTGLQLKARVSSSGGASVDDDLDGWSSVQSNHLGRTPSVTSISSTSVGSSTETPAIYGNEPSPLDHKVMLIAKSYYGRKAKHGIQRLAEGKYRIAGKIVFVRLLKDRHVMVRVGGGWDTLQHFLERHGGDSLQADISPSDLLPMDTRPSESTSRRRLSQSSLQSTPATPTLRRCTISTPISRSTMSSPEPWMSGSSGYSSASGGATRRKSLSRCESACGVSSLNVSRRRSITRKEADNCKGPVAHRASVNLPITKSESNGDTPCGVKSSQSSNSISTYKLSRYPNYLQSSQHITNKSSPTTANSQIHTRNSVVRRSSLKAF